MLLAARTAGRWYAAQRRRRGRWKWQLHGQHTVGRAFPPTQQYAVCEGVTGLSPRPWRVVVGVTCRRQPPDN